MNIVTVHNLKKYFGKGENQVKALDGIDLEDVYKRQEYKELHRYL